MSILREILVINLTRMGDLIMTAPLISGLKRKYPGAKITLLLNDKFEGITKYMDGVDRIEVFDLHSFASAGKAISIVELYMLVKKRVESLRAVNFDLAINVGKAPHSAIITGALDIPVTAGFTTDTLGRRIVTSQWLAYFESMLNFRKLNRFNLAELYQLAGGLDTFEPMRLEAQKADIDKADAILKSHGVADNELLIGFQPGASRADRRWPAERFATLADALASSGIGGMKTRVVIFGVDSERDISESIIRQSKSPIIDLAGKTSIGELVALTGRCAALVTNDTGTMHIAASVGTKIVGLFFAHAYVHETGPYGQGHVVLQSTLSCAPCDHSKVCHKPDCLVSVSSEDVFHALDACITTNAPAETSAKLASRRFSGCIPYVAGFDSANGQEYFPAGNTISDCREILAVIYRRIFRAVLGKTGRPENSVSVTAFADETVRHFSTSAAGLSHETLDATGRLRVELEKTALAATELGSISLELARIARRAAGKGKNVAVREMISAIAPLEREVSALAEENPLLAPLAVTFLNNRAIAEQSGSSPEQSAANYMRLNLCAELLRESVLAIVTSAFNQHKQ